MVEGQEKSAVGLLCPTCRVPLTMSERQGVEIDYCQQCRGVWLDRGELDKIIERGEAAAPVSSARASEPEPREWREDRHGGSHGSSHGGYRGGRRRKGFLAELFD